mmetsp:Transcript_8793/g.13190  ORF Transcript_8793/g.13190 Transcript_8793/m.13190 type:complete len:818 (+) Transcript_8793:176-2629(+)
MSSRAAVARCMANFRHHHISVCRKRFLLLATNRHCRVPLQVQVRHFSASVLDLNKNLSSLDDLETRTEELLKYLDDPTLPNAKEEGASASTSATATTTTTKTSITLAHVDEVMEGWSKWSNPTAAMRAEALLVALERNYDRLATETETSTGNGNGNGKAADADYSSASASALIPNAISYNHVCHAYAQSKGGTKAARRCEEILDRMMDRCRNFNDNELGSRSRSMNHRNTKAQAPPEPLVTTYNTVINAWSKSDDISAGSRAENIFRKMEQWNYDCKQGREAETSLSSSSSSVYKGVTANSVSLASVVDAWANSNHDNSFRRILAIFHHAVDKLRSNSISSSGPTSTQDNDELNGEAHTQNHGSTTSSTPLIAINTITCNSVLNGLAKSSKGIKAAEKAQEVHALMEDLNERGILQRAIDELEGEPANTKPNTTTFTLLIKCWGDAVKIPGRYGGEYAAKRCDEILHHMEEQYQNGENVKPNVITYTSCITAWSNCKSENGALQALSILEKMERMYILTEDEELQPNSIHYNACLSALCLAQTKETFEKANQLLLLKMQKKNIADTSSYNTIMNGHLRRDPTKSYAAIEELFQDMKLNGIQPDAITYNTIMNGLSKCGKNDAVPKAINLMDQMVEECKQNPTVTPTTITFTSALNVIAKSQISEKADPARKIFHQMLSMHQSRNDDMMKPDVWAFSALISACANQDGDNAERKRFALRLALGSYEQFCKSPEYGKPNAFIYGGLIKACGRLSVDQNEKGQLVQNVFEKCKREGLVSNAVMNIFLRSCPHHLKEKMLEGHNERRLPREWTRNLTKTSR